MAKKSKAAADRAADRPTTPSTPSPTSSSDTAPAASKPKPAQKPRLGRGLSSLMQVSSPAASGNQSTDRSGRGSDGTAAPPPPPAGDAVRKVPVDAVDVNPHQPRTIIGPAALAELAASIRTTGLIQPIVVRQKQDGRYELIAGERRLRASKLAELAEIRAIVQDVDELEQAQMALVENIQREDLNPMDRAEAYRTLQKQLGLTQTELAERLGEERVTVANYIRLLDLGEAARDLVREGKLTLGHAKVLAGVADPQEQARLAALADMQRLSVRNLERLVEAQEGPEGRERKRDPEQESRERYLSQLADTLGRKVGTRCSIKGAGRSGYTLTLHLKNADQFDRLMKQLDVDLD